MDNRIFQILLFVSLLLPAFSAIVRPPAPGGKALSPAHPKTTATSRHPGEIKPTPVIAAIEPGCTTKGTSTSCWVGINRLTATAENSQYLYITTGSTTVVATTTTLTGAGQTESGLVVAPVATSLALAIQSAVANGETDDQIKQQFQGQITIKDEANNHLQERVVPIIVWFAADAVIFFAVTLEYFRRTERKKAIVLPVIVAAKPKGPTLSIETVSICTSCFLCKKTLEPGKPTLQVTLIQGPSRTTSSSLIIVTPTHTSPASPPTASCKIFTGYCADDCYSNYDQTACAIEAGVGGMCHCSPPCQNQQCKPGYAPEDSKAMMKLKADAKAYRVQKSRSKVELEPQAKSSPTRKSKSIQ